MKGFIQVIQFIVFFAQAITALIVPVVLVAVARAANVYYIRNRRSTRG